MKDEREEEGRMDTDGSLPQEWLEAARDYNRPPETPAGEMWSGIEARLEEARVLSLDEVRGRRGLPVRRRVADWMGPAVAAAAVLVVGIGIGRLTAPGQGSGTAAVDGGVGAPAASASAAVQLAAMEHLGRTESLLSMVRADARTGRVDTEVGEWSRGLLAETRLLLDSPASDDPALRDLLEDLELILAQVAVVRGGEVVEDDRARAELEIIARGMEEQDVLSRIQAVLPAGPETGMTGI